jgi:hypothetical protein
MLYENSITNVINKLTIFLYRISHLYQVNDLLCFYHILDAEFLANSSIKSFLAISKLYGYVCKGNDFQVEQYCL